MYEIVQETGEIICPDGHVIPIPYEDDRYQEYAHWVNAGGVPNVV